MKISPRSPKPSNNFRRVSLRKPSFWLIIFATILLLGLITSSALHNADNVIQKRVDLVTKKPIGEREKELKSLSLITQQNRIVQRALANHYKAIGKGDLAAAAYANARPALLQEASTAALESYNFSLAETYLNKMPESKTAGEWKLKLAIAQLNLGENSLVCNSSDQAPDIQKACTLLKQTNISREQAYTLISLGIPMQAEKILANNQSKSNDDYITLASISQKQGEFEEAIRWLSDGFRQDQFAKPLLESILVICKERLAENTSCDELSHSAEKNLSLLLAK